MLPSHRRGQLGLLNVQVPGGYSWQPRLHRQIGLQGGDKCQPKPIKVTQPLFWLSDPVPLPAQHSCPPAEKTSPGWGRLVLSRDPNLGTQTPDPEDRSFVWSRNPKTEQRAQSRDPRTSPCPVLRLCSDDRQNCTCSQKTGSGSGQEKGRASPEKRRNRAKGRNSSKRRSSPEGRSSPSPSPSS